MQWQHSLDQHYTCDKKILLTSGCSFTSSTTQLETAASWPGYVMDRCRFDKVIDYSYPGSGNDYIADSILYHFENCGDIVTSDYFVIIMWTGIDRVDIKVPDSDLSPNLGGYWYKRLQPEFARHLEKQQAQLSFERILQLKDFLTEKKISFVFSTYVNLLFPPYIPKRDTTKEFDKWLSRQKIETLQKISWIPNVPMDFLYEYAFANDFLNSGDNFHPPVECVLEWTDCVLLPGMAQQGLIRPL